MGKEQTNDATRDRLRQGLNRTAPFDVKTVGHVTYSPLGRDSLFNLGKMLRVHPEVNGFYAIVTAAAANPEGWTLLDVLRQFPTDTIYVKRNDLLMLRQELLVYFNYREAVMAAIQQQEW